MITKLIFWCSGNSLPEMSGSVAQILLSSKFLQSRNRQKQKIIWLLVKMLGTKSKFLGAVATWLSVLVKPYNKEIVSVFTFEA
jgi:hypothetical protein